MCSSHVLPELPVPYYPATPRQPPLGGGFPSLSLKVPCVTLEGWQWEIINLGEKGAIRSHLPGMPGPKGYTDSCFSLSTQMYFLTMSRQMRVLLSIFPSCALGHQAWRIAFQAGWRGCQHTHSHALEMLWPPPRDFFQSTALLTALLPLPTSPCSPPNTSLS